MKYFVFLLAAVLLWSEQATAGEYATRKDAVAIVAKAVKAIAADRDGTLTAITAKNDPWVIGDLYPVVYDMSGNCLAHGLHTRRVGKNMLEMTDADGKKYIRTRVALAKSKNKFWQHYKFTDPVTMRVLPKSVYCEKSGDVIVCAGVYKR